MRQRWGDAEALAAPSPPRLGIEEVSVVLQGPVLGDTGVPMATGRTGAPSQSPEQRASPEHPMAHMLEALWGSHLGVFLSPNFAPPPRLSAWLAA